MKVNSMKVNSMKVNSMKVNNSHTSLYIQFKNFFCSLLYILLYYLILIC